MTGAFWKRIPPCGGPKEAVGDGQNAVCHSCGTASICVDIAGAILTAGNCSQAQVNGTILRTFQAQAGDLNVVSVRVAIREFCIPGGSAKNGNANAQELAVYQVLALIQLYGVGRAGGRVLAREVLRGQEVGDDV